MANATKNTKKARAKRRAWTMEQVAELKRYSKSRIPVARIAKAMKRTPGGLRQKALQLNIGLGHKR